MYKHRLLIISAKVLKLLLVFFLFSCESKPEPSKVQDTIFVDSVGAPSDSVNYKMEEEEEDSEEEDNGNPLVPQES